MKAERWRDLGDDELGAKESEIGQQMITLRFQLALKQVENPMKIRDLRRDLARIQTIRRERAGAARQPGTRP